MFRQILFVVTALLVGAPAAAQDKTAGIDKIFSWATPATPGCAVAVSQHGKLAVNRAYGLADLERDVPLSPGTVFDVGSLRKQFVAASILLLVEEGRLALSDDVRKLIPELPDYGNKITLVGLLLEKDRLQLDEKIQTYVPEFPAKQWPVSLRQLMGHLAGVRNDSGGPPLWPAPDARDRLFLLRGIQRLPVHPVRPGALRYGDRQRPAAATRHGAITPHVAATAVGGGDGLRSWL